MKQIKDTIYRTRFAQLSYEKHAANLWRVIDVETGCAVGPLYRTRIELLADLERYATDYGCDGDFNLDDARHLWTPEA